MSLTVVLSQALSKRLAALRRDGTLPWAGPDSKPRVKVEYRQDGGACRPLRVQTIVGSAQHEANVNLENVRSGLMEHVVRALMPENLLDDLTKYHVNPAGRFVVGGPHESSGLIGLKIIADTHGGWGAHGVGAFSGQDYFKVD
ncbi:S-adenosylmethionine synthase [Fasciola hepatica]|uniref:methionine adenosyltransferase n=1 Tax=Fasciola hepatica TaxID=6192 RepID=A0A2H1CCK7_FASHE|nr:S-adenosylmethionine synthase [Fasciola hepatica]